MRYLNFWENWIIYFNITQFSQKFSILAQSFCSSASVKNIKIPGMNFEVLVHYLGGVFSNISKFHEKPQKVRATLNHLSEEGSGQTAKEARKVAAKALMTSLWTPPAVIKCRPKLKKKRQGGFMEADINELSIALEHANGSNDEVFISG